MAIRRTFSTIFITGVETDEPDFKEFVIQMKLQSEDPSDAVEQSAPGTKQENGNWRIQPMEWPECEDGKTYEFRAAVRNQSGVLSEWSAWVTETAGDVTGPPNPVFALGQVELTWSYILVPLASYTKPDDFEVFEWYWDTEDIAPSVEPGTAYLEGESTIGRIGLTNIDARMMYIWVRARDMSGNYNSANWIASGPVNIAADANPATENVMDVPWIMKIKGLQILE